ncbi:hypothetical protein EB796_023964 [Bugula neritina]|uniref:Uncharacterized protein n=1 Tax=Bugula neritina TaxID=10212 RepID=A0A7J7IV16_BUGNE|nr:hypothetical protein EB796_023964 [Bugula neritina]
MLKVADKYLSAVKFTAGLIAQVANLGEQLQAVEVVSSSSHVIHVKHPDVAVKLSSCIQGNIMTLATDIQSKIENLKALRNQSQSLVTKVQFQLDNNRDSDIRQLSLRTETQPSVTDIALWTETLYNLMNEDFESRLLLFATWTPSNAKKVLDFCTQWSATQILLHLLQILGAIASFCSKNPESILL